MFPAGAGSKVTPVPLGLLFMDPSPKANVP